MKNSTLIFLGLLGVGAYFLLTKKVAAAPIETPAYNVSATTPQGVTITKKINSVKQGVEFINDNYNSGNTLSRTSQTLVKPTITSTGTTGGIAKLGTGAIVGITTINKGSFAEPSGYVAQPNRVPAKGELTPSGAQRFW